MQSGRIRFGTLRVQPSIRSVCDSWFLECAICSSWCIVSDDAEKVNYKIPGFLAKFWELQQVMWTTNAGLTDRHAYDSRPLSWPRLRRGIVSRSTF